MAAATVIGGCAGAGGAVVFTGRSAGTPRRSRGRERRRDLLARFGSGGRILPDLCITR
jgi:hypothetical protein